MNVVIFSTIYKGDCRKTFKFKRHKYINQCIKKILNEKKESLFELEQTKELLYKAELK